MKKAIFAFFKKQDFVFVRNIKSAATTTIFLPKIYSITHHFRKFD